MTIGSYVKKFSEASHCLVADMPLNADYPFKISRISKLGNNVVTLIAKDGSEYNFKIVRGLGREYCIIAQSSFFEKSFGRPPTKFKGYPFKDDKTQAIETTLFDKKL